MNVIVFKEKHSNRYFVYSTQEQLYKICLKILTERYSSGWQYIERKKPKDFQFIDTNVLAGLPKDIADDYRRKEYRYLRELAWHRDSVRFLDDCRLAIDSGDGKLAYELLQEHQDYEYEEFCIEMAEDYE